MAAPVILAEVRPRRTSDGAAVTVRLAGGGGTLPYRYAGVGWRAGIAGLPTIVASIDFKGDDLGGGGVSQAMVLRWAPSSSAALTELAAYHWEDAEITVRVGPEGAMPSVLLAGKVLKAPSQAGVLEITLADPAADLKKPVLTMRFAGTGGLEGPLEWEDRIKPRAWGRVFNVRGEVIDAANSIYCFGDPSRPWQAIDAVRDKGAAAAQLNVLGWQGSAAATFAALQAAVAPQGGGIACPSIACVKWWTQPAGALCADIRGEIGAGYVETAPEIAQRVAAVVSAVPFAVGTVAAAAAIRNLPVGWLVTDESTTAAQVLDQILGDVSLMWLLGDSEIAIRPWAWGPSVVSAQSHEVSRRSSFKPVAKRKLGYRKNWHVMSRDALAGIVLASDVVFDDGVTAEDLKPAAPGATPGAPNGFPIGGTLDPHTGEVIGGRPSEQVLADADKALLEQITGLAATELSRIRNWEALFAPDGADAKTLYRREVRDRLALAAIVTAAVANLDGVSASVVQILEALVDGEEGYARFLLRAQVDGDGNPTSIVGIEGMAGAGGSVLDFIANAIRMIDPVTMEPAIYFDTGAGIIKAKGVEVDTLKLNTAAINVLASASTPQPGTGAGGSWTTPLSATVVVPASGGWLKADFLANQGFSSGDEAWEAELWIDGERKFRGGGGHTQDIVGLKGGKYCAPGSRLVEVRWRAHSSITLYDRVLEVRAEPFTE